MEYSQGFIQIVGAFLILVIGVVLVRILGSVLKRVLKGLGLNKSLKDGFNLSYDVEKTLVSILRWILYLFVFLAAISELGIPSTTLIVILIVVLALVVLFALLAFKDLIPNFFSGIHLRKSKMLKVGDTINIKGIKGKIIDFSFMETKIELRNKEIVYIPNSLFYKEYVYKK